MSTSGMLTVGTRGSLLARSQTQWVIDRIQQANPGLQVQLVVITTTGDRVQGKALPAIGVKGLFTEELEQALIEGTIDLAVHSAKDVPTDLKAGLDIVAFPAREDPRDAWISQNNTPFDQIPEGSVIGTTSLRRQAQMLAVRPDLKFTPLRGNVDTRINKIHRGDCTGGVLAMAGVKRANLARHVTHPFDTRLMLPAAGQGALALEGRADDARVAGILAPIHHQPTALAVSVERAVLNKLGGGCQAPMAVLAQVTGDRITCEALVLDPAGSKQVRSTGSAATSDAAGLADRIVAELKAGGAEAIIAACRENTTQSE